MNETTTRIVDLPDNLSSVPPQYGSGGGSGGGGISGQPAMNAGNNAYIPMNVHPNPYGVSPDNNVMAHPMTDTNGPKINSLPPMPPQISAEQMMQQFGQYPQQRLPSRDIPRDTTSYLHDEQVQANYIPRSNQSTDFVRDYENVSEKKLETHEQKKHRARMVDNLIEELQVPFLVALLFLIFQMPALNSFLFRNFAFLHIYGEDGNMNFYGWLFKATCFGAAYYAVTNFTNYISEL